MFKIILIQHVPYATDRLVQDFWLQQSPWLLTKEFSDAQVLEWRNLIFLCEM